MSSLAVEQRTDPPGTDQHWLVRHGPLLALLVAAAVLGVLQMRDGHDWGDDFALYIDQARALVDGDVAGVVERTTFTVDHSSWRSFSPYAYPWGFPALLAPVYALFGIDFTAFKVFELALFLGFLTAFAALVRPRIDALAATVLVAFLAVSQLYVGWVNVVLSEFPFVCFATTSLVVIDLLAAPPQGQSRARAIWSGVGLGLLLALTVSIRLEGVVLFAALAARQALTLWDRRDGWRPLVVPFAAPYLTAALVVGTTRLALPTEAGPALADTGGLGRHNWDFNVTFYREAMGQSLGLDRVLGARGIALVLLALCVLAVAGVVLRWREDLPLSITFVGLSLLYLSLPYREPRYLYLTLAFGLYFAMQALRVLDIRALPLQPRHAALLLLVALGSRLSAEATDFWRTYPQSVPGPETPSADDMFEVVRDRVPDGDVVAFFRARAMNLFGERQSLQLTSLAHILERADWYVMARGSSYSQCLLEDSDAAATGRMTKVYENGQPLDGWVLWKIDRSSPLTDADLAALPPCRP